MNTDCNRCGHSASLHWASQAYAAQSKHLREWVEGPRKVSAQGAAPTEPIPPVSEPEGPALSIFDPEQVARDVAAKLAAERK